MTAHQPGGLESWVEKLSASGLPIFSETVRAVSGVVSRQETSAHDLAKAIGQDASLAARLLKIANSPLFNLQNRNIDTISAAVVLLGFDAVRDLAVSLSLIEQVLKGKSHERVTRSMARSFHAAAQARAFAAATHDACPEEVFVAALLMNIGEMAFWAAGDDSAQAIERMARSGASMAEAEQHVLGFRLEALSGRLVEEWHLGNLLEEAVAGTDSERVAHVRLGHDIARVVEQFGWDSREVRKLLSGVGEHLSLDAGRTQELVHGNVETAAKIASRYGVPRVESVLRAEKAPPAQASPGPKVAHNGPDAVAQLKTLQAIATELEAGTTLDALLDLVLSGVTRGVGFDRAYFALLAADRRSLRMKQALGRSLAPALAVGDSAPEPSLFDVLLKSGKALMLEEAQRDALAEYLPARISPWLAPEPAVLMPVTVAGKVVGVLEADNAPSGAPIDDDAFAGFRHFGQQIAMGLAGPAR